MGEPKLVEKKWKKELEADIAHKWRVDNVYSFDVKSDKQMYIIDTPPPYVNAPIHIGHAATYTMQDMFARYHRMLGEEVLFPLGLDRNGLPIEVAAEKKFKVRLHEQPREEALELCKKILEKTTDESIVTFERLGLSFSSWDFHTGKPGEAYMTDNPVYRTLTQDTFIDLWNKGLIHFDKRINNYSPGLRTTIADSEIEYVDLPSKFIHVKWKVKETGEEIIIATTRPELIASCGMIIYNPKDERYSHLKGKHAVVPIYGFDVPIKAHPDAKIDKGSGLVMMCSAGDYTDIRFFRDQGLESKISINLDCTMKSNTGFLEGVHVNKARVLMAERLKKDNLVVKEESVMHRTPVCERSKMPIEFLEMEEIYLKQMDFVSVVENISSKIRFFDPRSRQILLDWLKKIGIDWPISRRRFYATEIPLWRCEKCGRHTMAPEKGKYWQPWKDACPVDKCPECGGSKFCGEKRVFDTWFDSSISVLFNLQYLRDDSFFRKNPVCSLRPQGKEIVRTWLYYTLLRGYFVTGKAIFKDVWVHNHIVDETGRKMSKSLGNGIDPQQLMEKFGSESFRFWCVLEGNIHQSDLRCSFERVEGCGKTLTKLWNVSRFISSFDYDSKAKYKLMEPDKWLIAELNKLILGVKKGYDKYDFHGPVVDMRSFLWDNFASHYLEMVKRRAYNEEGLWTVEERNGAVFTLNYALQTLLKLMAPIVPMITHKICKELYGSDVHKEMFPIVEHKVSSKIDSDAVFDINSAIWKFKKDNSLSLKNNVAKVALPELYKPIEKDLVLMHNIDNIIFRGKEISISLK